MTTLIEMHPYRERRAARDKPLGDWIDGQPYVEGAIASLDVFGYLIAMYESQGYRPTLGPTAAARMTAAGGKWARLADRLNRKETP